MLEECIFCKGESDDELSLHGGCHVCGYMGDEVEVVPEATKKKIEDLEKQVKAEYQTFFP